MVQVLPTLAVACISFLAGALTLYILQSRKNSSKDSAGKGTTPEHEVLKKYIDKFAMVPTFRAYSKKEAIEQLVDIAGQRFPDIVTKVDEAKQAVYKREESMATGLDYGIAVPHGRTAAVRQICGVIALVDNSKNDNGIIPDYETIDHSKIQIICLMLIPESMNASYLQMLSTFIRIFQNADNREQLLSCKTPKDMKRFFNSR